MNRETIRRFIYGLVLVNLIPNYLEVDIWVIVISISFLLWRVLSDSGYLKPPKRFWVNVFVILSATGLYYIHGNLWTPDTSIPLLVLMVSYKLFETQKDRDMVLLILLCYLLLMFRLVLTQTLLMTAFLVLDVVLITTMLALYHSPNERHSWRSLGSHALRITLQAVPIAALLFFLFPRFNMGMYRPSAQSQATTEFSDSVDPGQVAKLAQSEKVVMRVSFPESYYPTISELYWRGAILNNCAGLRWRRSEESLYYPMAKGESGIQQEVILEPTQKPYLFGLDWPLSAEFITDSHRLRVRLREGRVLQSQTDVLSLVRYKVWSTPDSEQITWPPPSSVGDIICDLETAPRAQRLAKRWASETADPDELVKKIREFFVSEDFRYTLEPGKMASLDDFLFSERRGFCEHFSSAMASMLRVAGVPARVVAGYQGGTMGLFGEYLIVRNLDAHAWVEYWSERKGAWVRQDPTQWVAPERLRLGGAAYREAYLQGRLGDDNLQVEGGRVVEGPWSRMFAQGLLMWDMVESSWASFVLTYDFSWQKQFLEKLGFSSVSRKYLWLLLGSSLVFVLAILYLISLRQKEKVDPLLSVYRLLCERLAKRGLPRQFNEGPISYRDRILMEKDKAGRTEAAAIIAEIVEVRYGQTEFSAKKVKNLRKQIKALDIAS
ncbi:MAG: DUF3488 domain-containing transglutaminase family protein [Pseudobdellovibrionaceae bacterium]|nr:DUF3488 domain-containing transglutaminase family protein [Bdellovibrionales bacterium]USN48717.1 MAG: DUF3488 domain-containing transglutaminase family protein [Pseudobdellovibrionaceae bacterium]